MLCESIDRESYPIQTIGVVEVKRDATRVRYIDETVRDRHERMTEGNGRRLFSLIRGRIIVTVEVEFRKRCCDM